MPEKKTRGYRVRLTVFVPCDHADMNSTEAAIAFAKKYSVLLPDAPAGTVIEAFASKPGQEQEKS